MAQLTTNNNNLDKLKKYSDTFKQYFTDLSNLQYPDINQVLNELSNMLKNFIPKDDDITQLKLKLKGLSDEFEKQLKSIETSLDDTFKDVLFYDQIKVAFTKLADALKQMADSNSFKPNDFANLFNLALLNS